MVDTPKTVAKRSSASGGFALGEAFGHRTGVATMIIVKLKLSVLYNMASSTIARFLFSRGDYMFSIPLRARAQVKVSSLPLQSVSRYASTKSTSSKPRVLEKPSKFTPPSHPARINRAPPRQYPGPPLSAPELEAQKTKQYPHMMAPEGSFMRWFLTNRSIHMWITLVCSSTN